MEGGSTVTATFPITAAMLTTVSDMFTSAVEVAAPVGLGMLAVMIGIRAVPKIINAMKGKGT